MVYTGLQNKKGFLISKAFFLYPKNDPKPVIPADYHKTTYSDFTLLLLSFYYNKVWTISLYNLYNDYRTFG